MENENSFNHDGATADERQDPAEQYSTETQVETEPQGDGAASDGGNEESSSAESGSSDSEGGDGGDDPATTEPVTVAPEGHNAGNNLQALDSGDVSQEPAPHVNGLGMTYSEERGHRMA